MSTLPQNDIALVIGGTAYLGWTSIEIERGFSTISGSFSLELASKERTAAADFPIEDGAACEVRLGDDVLITGYVDEVTRSIDADMRKLRVRGRDKAADLVDCSAIHKPGSWRGKTLQAIAAELAAPFGIAVNITGDTGKPFTRFALQQGETVFAAIERMARYRGLVAWSPGDGSIRIGNPDLGIRTGRLVEGVNVKSAEGSRDTSQRFSDYIVKGQASGSDSRNGAAVAQVKGEARDAGVARYRPMVVVGEEQSDAASLKKRAEWEAAVRNGRSRPASITVVGWRDDAGAVWQPGARSACDVPSCRIVGDMLVERVRLTRDAEQGTLTDLDVVPPEAWTQLAEPEAQS